MSTNKLSHLKEGEKIYLEVTKQYPLEEGDFYYGNEERFDTKESYINVSDNDTFYTLEELKTLANDGMPNGNMPKQGEIIQVSNAGDEWGDVIRKGKFVAFYDDKVIIHNPVTPFYSEWDSWRYPPQKTELTLEQVEEKLGMEKGSLNIITN